MSQSAAPPSISCQPAACGCGSASGSRLPTVTIVALLVATVLALAWLTRPAPTPRVSDRGPQAAGAAADRCADFDHSHRAWSALLARHVHDGVVEYAGIKRTSHAALASYLGALQSVCPTHFAGFSREQKLAFWINAYNAFTVKLILDHAPLDSIRSIGTLPGAAFREHFIPLQVGGKSPLSLNDIEHEQLRKHFAEPRIHFAIVCASKSCPALRSEAYREGGLDAQLDTASRAFVRDPSKNRFDARTKTAQLSALFEWFAEDFERAAGSVPQFVARYASDSDAVLLRGGDARIEHLDYDWTLNGR